MTVGPKNSAVELGLPLPGLNPEIPIEGPAEKMWPPIYLILYPNIIPIDI